MFDEFIFESKKKYRQFEYDPYQDVFTIEGVKYTGIIFDNFTSLLPLGVPFVIEKRGDGYITIRLATQSDFDAATAIPQVY